MIKQSLLIIISLISVLSCKGPQVVSFLNPRIDFSNFKTYRIVSPGDGSKEIMRDSASVNPQIIELLNSEMTGRGYEYNPKSDLRLQYNFISNNKTDIDVSPNYYSRRSIYSSPYSAPYGSYNIRQRNFYEAILLVELKDRTAKTVWQGSLNLRYSKKIKDKDQILPTAVMKIFESYSYKAGSNKPVQLSDEKTGN